jgi:outer membrane lipoprotein carrier protein
MSGVFKFQRPGKFVWNYEKPYEQGIYCNGRTISVWDPDLRQVTVKAIASSMPSSPAAILFGNNDFRRDFTVKDAGTKDGLEWIDAVPKLHDTSFTDIRIGFRDGLPAAMTLKDSFGQTITLHMSDMKKNPSISSSAFEFRPPKGAEILRQ